MHNILPRTLTTTSTKTPSYRSRSRSPWPGAGSCSPSTRSLRARSLPRSCELSPPRGTICYVSPALRRCSIASRFRTTNNRYDTIVRACIESALVTWVGLLLYEICSLAPNGHVVVRLPPDCLIECTDKPYRYTDELRRRLRHGLRDPCFLRTSSSLTFHITSSL